MDIGAHCSMPACHQQDFLPFKCNCCCDVFCLDHRSYDMHKCSKAGSHDRRVVQCPVCKQMIRWTAEQDVNAVWEEHVRIDKCTHEKFQQQQQLNQQSKPRKKRCAADSCRQLLLVSNQFHCKQCGQDVCLKHRFEPDHDCDIKRRNQSQQWLEGFKAKSTSFATPKQTSQFQRNAQNAVASVASGTKVVVSSIVQNAKSIRNAVTTSSEECPMCQQKFAYVSQLVAHVNRAHPDTLNSSRACTITAQPSTQTAASTAPAGNEVCPQCRASFPTLTARIQHAETAHSEAAATGSSGRDHEICSIM